MKKISNILNKDKKKQQQYNSLDAESNTNQDNHQPTSQSPSSNHTYTSNSQPPPQQESTYEPISRTGLPPSQKDKQPSSSQQKDNKDKKDKKEKKDVVLPERRHTTAESPRYNKTHDPQYEDKIIQLKSMFETLDDIVIRLTLDDCQGNVERAIDSLLNIVALASSQKDRRPGQGRLSLSEAASNVKKKINSTLRGNGTAPPNQQEALPPGFDETVPLDQQLIQATKTNNAELVKYFFKELKPLLNRDVSSLMNVCVIIAIEENNETMLKLFLDNGAESDGDQVMTPLLCSLENSKPSFARMLIEKYNANVNKSLTNLTPLHLATKRGYADIVNMMIKRGATVNRVDIVSGKTALHFAVDKNILPSNQQFEMVSTLLEGGCDLGFKDVHGDIPLHICSRQASNADDLMVLCLLLERSQENPAKYLNASNTKSGDCMLHMIVDRIIFENLPITQKSSRSKIDGPYILDLALRYFPDPDCKNASGKTALEMLLSTSSFANPTVQKDLAAKLEAYTKQYRSGQRRPSSALAQSNSPPPQQPVQQAPLHSSQPVPVQPAQSHAKKLSQSQPVNTNFDSDEEETQLVNKRRGTASQTHANNNNNMSASPASHYAAVSVQAPPAKTPQQIAAENQVKIQHSLEVALIKKFRQNVESALETSLEEEYNYIEKLTENSTLVSDFTSALQPCNIKKNRYKNILPFENTRVKLSNLGYEGSDFISASYIQAGIPGSDMQYIATQGPLEHTINDFWRMLWEHHSNIIVMLANQIENGKEKVAVYWPREDKPDAVMETDLFILTLVSVEKLADQVIARKIRVINKGADGERDVYHIQYCGWPDQGIPENPRGFLGVLSLVDDINVTRNFNSSHQGEGEPETHPPMIVHCSAGIGRSGVFCTVHSTFTKLKYLISNTNSLLAAITGSEDYKDSDEIPASLTNFLDFKDTVLRMRQQRVGLVQTKDQYVFCYLTLKETLPFFEKLITYKNEKWFHKNLTQAQAAQLVGSKPLGAFLFRESTWPGSLMLTVQTRNGVVHQRVSITLHGFTLENETNVYPSLVALVESHQEALMHPLLK